MTANKDRRQEILTRLDTLLSGLTITLSTGAIPAGSFVHNRNELPKDLVPGIILLDADEVQDPRGIRLPDGRQLPMGIQLMKMTPEIYVVLDVRKPKNIDVGEDLNTARAAILAAIFIDAELRAICGSNGGITYDGCVTDLARNRTMQGQLGLSISFTYMLSPTELQTNA
jgi:hypothetical protein